MIETLQDAIVTTRIRRGNITVLGSGDREFKIQEPTGGKISPTCWDTKSTHRIPENREDPAVPLEKLGALQH